MLPILQPAQMRSDHRTNGTGVGGAVGVTAYIPVNGADVQTRAAANAMKRVPLFRIGQQLRAPVVDEHDVVLLRTVKLALLPRTAIERVVARQRLARSGGGEHRQKE